MAKRNNRPTRETAPTKTAAGGATTTDGMEQRVLAFAEQVGRMVGTIQVKAEGWMDREALNTQLANVRDGASHLLKQLAGGRTAVKKKSAAAATAGKGKKGRSGGAVDAPGKKHRKQAPPDPDRAVARSQASKMRTAMPMAKTSKRRGRG
jgi:hypothetical protein